MKKLSKQTIGGIIIALIILAGVGFYTLFFEPAQFIASQTQDNLDKADKAIDALVELGE